MLDTKKEHLAVAEANKLGIPVVAVVDTNCDPDLVQYVIPGNDDAIRASQLMCRVIADAVIEGKYIASKRVAGRGPDAGRRGPLARGGGGLPVRPGPGPPAGGRGPGRARRPRRGPAVLRQRDRGAGRR